MRHIFDYIKSALAILTANGGGFYEYQDNRP